MGSTRHSLILPTSTYRCSRLLGHWYSGSKQSQGTSSRKPSPPYQLCLTPRQLYIFNVLPSILSIIFPTSSAPPPATTRAKANYAFSSAVKHWPLVTSALSSNSSQGYNTLLEGVADSEPVIRRKMAFLVGTLTMQSGEKYEGEIPNEVRNLIEERIKETAGQPSETLVDGLKHSGVYSALIKALASGSGDVEFEGNALNALARAAEKGGLSGSEKAQVKTFWESWTENDREERSLGGEDGKEISAALA